MNQRFEAGQFVTFTYNPPSPPPKVPKPGQMAAPVSDRNKSVMVLHASWQDQMHGLDLKRITPAEIQVLKAVMDPDVKAQVDAGQWPIDGVPPYLLVRDILKRMYPTELVKSPMAFYAQLVKPFIRDKECYRRYNNQYVFGVRVVVESKVGGPVNSNPLFHG